MKGYIHDVSDKARENTYFRQVLETGEHTQLVVMSIPAGGEIGEETHGDNDQVLYFVSGEGKAIFNGEEVKISKDDVVLVNAGTKHNFINTGKDDLKIITAYSPPHHPPGTIHKTKAEADAAGY
ncbi:MAG: cupin [Candidatus Woykebacteria bacterium RIFCSPHIGHO2_12_FULL_45_10]|uniref:Cupin n=1 Tax=Candidatus Woykebacteria bacterium RIFCSPHIGHO2_12_FULL_45_10 TaxID=1802603 RepID=A0A1G1WRW4_9BACT|nr:MAG: cupin [Candidatus Woykebacteria bacterium RIFCSPHIGHO2_12_FULL_45_10]